MKAEFPGWREYDHAIRDKMVVRNWTKMDVHLYTVVSAREQRNAQQSPPKYKKTGAWTSKLLPEMGMLGS